MIPIGQPYRAAGPLDFRSIFSALILGIFTASLAALVVWGWEISPIPTLVLLTPVLQGLLIGLVIAFVIGRLKLRNVGMLALMGFLCGLASVGLVHVGHHIRVVHNLVDSCKERIQSEPTLTPEQKAQALDRLEKEPNQVVDTLLTAMTGHQGLIGSLILRSQIGVTIKQAQVTGWGMWILWGVEASIVAATALAIARDRAARPFCEDCHEWCRNENGQIALPGTASGPLVVAVTSDDLAGLATLRDHPPEPNGTNYTGTILHPCPSCDQTFADVWLRTDKPKGKNTETKVTTIASLVRISPEMVAILRNQPASVAEEVSEAELEEDLEDEPAEDR